MEKRSTRKARELVLTHVLMASFCYILTKELEKGKRGFCKTERRDKQKTESRPISVWSPELCDGLGKPTEVAGLLPRSTDKRTGGKTNRIRKEFLPPGKI